MRRDRAVLVALALLSLGSAACASVATAGAGGYGEPGGRHDRVLVPRFADVYAVAMSQRFVYIATDGALGVYDRLQRTWQPPVTIGDAGPLERITALAADPTADAVWVGATGVVSLYEPALDLWTRAIVPGRVERIAFDTRDPAGGALVLSGGSWSRVSRTGAVTPLMPGDMPGRMVVPPTLAELRREYPSLMTLEPMLTRESNQRSWPVIAGARAPGGISDVWLGTWGDGALEVDPNFARATHQPFGLLGAGAAALATTPDGIWIGPAGLQATIAGDSPSRAALTFVSPDLRRWEWMDLDVAPGGRQLEGLRVTRIVVRGNAVWLATDRGVLEARDAGRGTRDAQITMQADAEPATDLALWGGALAVASQRGLDLLDTLTLLRVSSASRVPRPASLLAVFDTLYAATATGVYRLLGDDTRQLTHRPARALARSDSVLVVASEGELFSVDAAGVEHPLFAAVDFREVGQITRVALDARSVAVAGPLGVVVVSRATGAHRFERTTGDTYDVALTPDYIWIGTRDGLLRVRRTGDLVP